MMTDIERAYIVVCLILAALLVLDMMLLFVLAYPLSGGAL